MNIKQLAESFKYELSPEEMENEPVIFMILQSPMEFGRIFIDELRKEYSISKYEERNFFEKMKDIIKEGPSKLSSFSGFGDGISVPLSSKEDENNGIAHIHIVLNGLKLTTKINQAYYVFNSKEITTRQFAKKIIEKVKKLKGYYDYENYDDEDYAYDINLNKFKNHFTSFYLSQGTFSYSGVDVMICFPNKLDNVVQKVRELAKSDSYYSPFEWGRFFFCMKYLDSILDDIFQYFTDEGYNIEPHPDTSTQFRITKVHDFTPEELSSMNDSAKKKYRQKWFTSKSMQNYKENEKKAVRVILTAGESEEN